MGRGLSVAMTEPLPRHYMLCDGDHHEYECPHNGWMPGERWQRLAAALLDAPPCSPRTAERAAWQSRFSISSESSKPMVRFRDWVPDPRVRPFYIQNKWIRFVLGVLFPRPEEGSRRSQHFKATLRAKPPPPHALEMD